MKVVIVGGVAGGATASSKNPHEDFYVMNGNRALIKREKFERYLDQATAV